MRASSTHQRNRYISGPALLHGARSYSRNLLNSVPGLVSILYVAKIFHGVGLLYYEPSVHRLMMFKHSVALVNVTNMMSEVIEIGGLSILSRGTGL